MEFDPTKKDCGYVCLYLDSNIMTEETKEDLKKCLDIIVAERIPPQYRDRVRYTFKWDNPEFPEDTKPPINRGITAAWYYEPIKEN